MSLTGPGWSGERKGIKKIKKEGGMGEEEPREERKECEQEEGGGGVRKSRGAELRRQRQED